MRFALRLLTTLSFFLPFTFFVTTCNNGLQFSYNQREADSNMLVVQQSVNVNSIAMAPGAKDTVMATDSIITAAVDTADIHMQEQDNEPKSNDLGIQLVQKALTPTDSSLSGIGVLFYFKNLAGKIFIGGCLLIVLSLLVAYRFIKSKRTSIYLMLAGLLFLAAFILDSLVSAVTILWGTWLLVALMLIQLRIELRWRPQHQSRASEKMAP